MSTKPDTPSTFPASKRKSRVGFLDLFVSQTEIDKLRKELQLRQDVSCTSPLCLLDRGPIPGNLSEALEGCLFCRVMVSFTAGVVLSA